MPNLYNFCSWKNKAAERPRTARTVVKIANRHPEQRKDRVEERAVLFDVSPEGHEEALACAER
jgi:hypothetical protein